LIKLSIHRHPAVTSRCDKLRIRSANSDAYCSFQQDIFRSKAVRVSPDGYFSFVRQQWTCKLESTLLYCLAESICRIAPNWLARRFASEIE
jgi:hypothetical protein